LHHNEYGILPLIIQLVSGAVGGNIAGTLMNKFSLGALGNSLVGILGGGLGGQILGMLGVATSTDDSSLASVVGSVAAGAVGGLMAVIGIVKNMFRK